MTCFTERSWVRVLRASALLFALLASSAWSFPAGQQTYYVLGNEQLLLNVLKTVDTGEAGGTFLPAPPLLASSIVSLTVPAANQTIVYDHVEDGYEADLANPVQGSTQTWGDGDLTNGIAPGDPGNDDLLTPGQVIKLESTLNATCGPICAPVPINPRGAALRWDGGDRVFTVGQPMTAVHTVFPADSSTPHTAIGGTWELFALEAYENDLTFSVPVGVDTYADPNGNGIPFEANEGDAGFFENFKYAEIVVQANEDGTILIVDNGAGPPLSFTLDAGESWSSLGEFSSGAAPTPAVIVNQNTTVTGSQPFQVGLVSAGAGTFQSRFYNIIPTGIYASEYLSPVYSGATGLAADLFINNPNTFPITVTAETQAGTVNIPVAANAAASFAQANGGVYVPTGSAVRLTSSNLFWGIGAYDTGALGGNGTGGDWGWVLQANGFLEDAATVPHGPGNGSLVGGGGTGNGSPIWVGALDDSTTITVDWNGDGIPDPADTTNDGNPNGTSFLINALQSLVLYDLSGDNDQAPARIEADGKFSAAWGYNGSGGTQDPGVTNNVDWGYSVNPFDIRNLEPALEVEKTANPKSVAPPATVTFTITVSSGSRLVPVEDVDIVDELPSSAWAYVAGSAILTYPDATSVQLDPTISLQTLTWDISQTLQTQEQVSVTFQATVAGGTCAPVATTATEDWNTPGSPANPQSYQNGAGWTGNWIESGETNGPTSGQVRVRGSSSCFDNHLEIRRGTNNGGTPRRLTRIVDTSGFCAPQVAYTYQTNNLGLASGESMVVEASTDGVIFTPVRIYEGDTNACANQVLDLSAFQGATTYLRFSGDPNNSNGQDRLLVDDIVVSDAAGGVPADITEDFQAPGAPSNPESYLFGAGWGGDWLEAGDDLDPTNGTIQVAAGVAGGPTCDDTNHLVFTGGSGDTVTRRLSLAGFANPQLTFERRVNFTGGGEFYHVEISTDGTTFNTLRTYDQADNSAACATETFTAAALCPTPGFCDTDVFLRFHGSGGLEDSGGAQDNLWIDDIRITEVAAAPSAPFWDNEAQATGRVLDLPVRTDDTERVYNNPLSITLAVDQAQARVGDTLTYTVTVQNSGGVAVPGVDLRLPVPAFTTLTNAGTGTLQPGSKTVLWNLGAVAPGPPQVFTIQVSVNQAPFDKTPVTDIATLLVGGVRTLDSNEVETLIRTPIFQLVKKAPGAVSAGNTLLYEFDLFNNGGAPGTGVVLTDRMPASTVFVNDGTATPNAEVSVDNGLTYTPIGAHPPGPDPTVTHVRFLVGTMGIASLTTARFTVRVPPATPNNTIVRNVALLTNNETTIRTTNIVETIVSDLQMSISTNRPQACPRRRLINLIQVRNNGVTPFNNVVVLQPIPDFTDYEWGTANAPAGWLIEYSIDGGTAFTPVAPAPGVAVTHLRYTLPALGPGQVDQLRFDSRVGQFVPGGVSVTIQGTIDSTETPPISSNVLVLPTVNVRVVKSADVSTQTPGGVINYTLEVQNIGASPAVSPTIEDPFLGFNLFTETTMNGGSITGGGTFDGTQVTWNLPTLIPDAPPLILQYAVTVNAGAATGTNILNVASVLTGGCDTASNLVQVLVAGTGVTAGPDSTGYGDPGDTITFSNLVRNESTTATDTFELEVSSADSGLWPVGTTVAVYLDVDADGIYDPGLDVLAPDTDGDLRPETSALSPGETQRILFRVTIPGGAAQDTSNAYTVTARSMSNGAVSDSFVDTARVIGPTSIRLDELVATEVSGGVQVRWRTSQEFQNRGFLLARGPTGSGPWTQVGCCLIEGAGIASGPRAYFRLDPEAPSTGPLYYRLTDVDYYGVERHHPPVGVDRDGDGIPFDQEQVHGLSDSDASDGAADPDGDGVATAQELATGRDPFGIDILDVEQSREVADATTPPPDGLRLVSETADYRIYELHLSRYELRRRTIAGEEYSYPSLPTLLSGTTEEPGLPHLPVVGTHLPDGFDWAEVEEVEAESTAEITVGPAPHTRQTPSNILPRYEPDLGFYSSGASYPSALLNVRRSTPAAPGILELRPFTYDHGSRRLVFRRRMRVRVHRSPGTEVGVARAGLIAGTAAGLSAVPPGPIFRIRTSEPGLYRVTGADLTGAGANLTTVDPRHVAVYRGGQAIPARLTGEADGSFDPGDALEFFAWDEGDRYAGGDGFHVLLGTSPALRWATRAAPAPTGLDLAFYRHTETRSFRDYYVGTIVGPPDVERFAVHTGLWVNNTTPRDFPIEVHDPAPEGGGGVARVVYGASADFAGAPDHRHLLRFDGVAIADQRWSGRGQRVAAGAVPPAALTAGAHAIRLEASLDGLPPAVTFDFFTPQDVSLSYDRRLVARGDRLRFEAPAGTEDLRLEGFSSPAITVLDVTDPAAPVRMTGAGVSGSGPFQAELGRAATAPTQILAFGPSGTLAPASIRPVERAGLRSTGRRAGWLAIVPDTTWASALAPLVAVRAAQGLEPMVVSLQDAADEFTGGVIHPEAIRRLLATARQRWARAPEYLFLAGDGHANPREYAGLYFPGFPFTSDPLRIPTPLSVAGPARLARETPDDAWYGRLAGHDDLPEVAVGRVTAQSPGELAGVAAKLADYATRDGAWRREVLAIADDGEPIFPRFSDDALTPLLPGLGVQRLYQSDPRYPSLAAYQASLQSALSAGAVLLQYVGHGGFTQWTSDAVLDVPQASALGNVGLPLVLSMTCEDSYLGDVTSSKRTLGEALVMNPSGGAVAFLGSGIQTTAAAKDLLHRSWMQALFQEDHRRLGDAMRRAAALYLANTADPEHLLRAFTLIGDPATKLRLANPRRPTGLVATRDSSGTLLLSWAPVPGATSYQVFRRVGSSPLVPIATTAEPNLVLPGTPNGVSADEQYFSVRAFGSAGLGSALAEQVRTQALLAGPTGGEMPDGTGIGGCSMTGRGAPFSSGALAWILVLLAGFRGRRRRRRR